MIGSFVTHYFQNEPNLWFFVFVFVFVLAHEQAIIPEVPYHFQDANFDRARSLVKTRVFSLLQKLRGLRLPLSPFSAPWSWMQLRCANIAHPLRHSTDLFDNERSYSLLFFWKTDKIVNRIWRSILLFGDLEADSPQLHKIGGKV